MSKLIGAWHLDGVQMRDEGEFVRAWFGSRVPATVAAKDVATADAALAKCEDAAALAAFGVPLAKLRAWALPRKAVAIDAQPIDALPVKEIVK